jgi:hypothetical protein
LVIEDAQHQAHATSTDTTPIDDEHQRQARQHRDERLYDWHRPALQGHLVVLEQAAQAHHDALATGATTERVRNNVGQLGVLSADNAANQQRQGVQLAALVARSTRGELQQTASYGTRLPVRVAHEWLSFGRLVANLEGDPITPGMCSFHPCFPNILSVR